MRSKNRAVDARDTMRQHQRVFAVGVVLVLLGIVMTIGSIITTQETRWVVDPLQYREVTFLPGYRNETIHIIALDGRIYRLPAGLWDAQYDGRDLTQRLSEDDTAVARVRGGDNRLLFGYPTIESFETASLRLEAPPAGRARIFVGIVGGPVLAVVGFALARRARGRRRQSTPKDVAPTPD